MEKSKVFIIEVCEEIGYALGTDPYFIYTDWHLERIFQSFWLNYKRKTEKYSFFAALQGIDLEGKNKKVSGGGANSSEIRDVFKGKGRLYPNLDKIGLMKLNKKL